MVTSPPTNEGSNITPPRVPVTTRPLYRTDDKNFNPYFLNRRYRQSEKDLPDRTANQKTEIRASTAIQETPLQGSKNNQDTELTGSTANQDT